MPATLNYLSHHAIFEPCHIQNPVYPGKHRHFGKKFRDIPAYSGILVHYWGIRQVQVYLEPYVSLVHFRTLPNAAYYTKNMSIIYVEPFCKKCYIVLLVQPSTKNV